ncbi:MAG: cytochrome c oxidase subunit II [Paracoccaceae bacterium]
MKRFGSFLTVASAMFMSTASLASDVAGKPVPAGHHFQRAVTPVMEDIVWLDDFLHIIIFGIVVFVTGLMAYCVLKFERKKNPEPATFTHNTTVEVLWTAIPVVILVIIAIPSIKLLFLQLDVPEADLTIKATGNQWNWSYQYPDEGVEFDAYMLGAGQSQMNEEVRAELTEYGYQEDEWLLATDERVVVPVNANVHVLVTASDVIHAWAVPSFGSKIDAMPGRINEAWFRATEIGTYFGQCSELCGKDHTYMPIVVEVVSQEDYDTWILEMASRDVEPAVQTAQITNSVTE